jgi:hypothetical protein
MLILFQIVFGLLSFTLVLKNPKPLPSNPPTSIGVH